PRGSADSLGQFSAIKCFAARRGDRLQRRGVIRRGESLARHRRTAVGAECFLPILELREQHLTPLPRSRCDWGNQKSLARVMNRRLEQLFQRQLAKSRVK